MFATITRPDRRTLRELVSLAIPIVVVQLGLMLMVVVDTMVVGRVSAVALGAVAIGNLYSFWCIAFGFGVLLALDPIVAQAVGAKDLAAVPRALQRGVIMSVAATIPTSLALWPAASLFHLAHQSEELIPLAAAYVRWTIPGVLAFYLFVAFRQTLQAVGRIAPVVWTIVAANVLNLVLNLVLVFGKFGFPALGVTGSAMATTCSRWFMVFALLCAAWRHLRPCLWPVQREAFELRPLLGMLRVGAPIGFQFMLEFGVFGVVGLMMGTLGASQVAAHQVVLNLVSFTFNVPVGISSAGAVMVGRAVGAEDPQRARNSAGAALLLAILFMSATGALFLSIPRFFAELYTKVPEVLLIATQLLPLGGVFQIFDGIQVTSIGILRGVGDTRTPMLINILGFWFLGFPVSIWLGLHAGYGPRGLWWGLVLGLVAVAIFLVLRVQSKLRRGFRRLDYESPGSR